MSASTEDLVAFLRGLRQVREFTAEPVSEAIINDILEVGRWSGSSANTQPTELLVVRDPEVRRKIGDWGAKPAAAAPLSFLILSQHEAFGVDEGRMGERLMLAARAYGLGASFATLKNEGPDAVKQLLGIPADRYARGHFHRPYRPAGPRGPGKAAGCGPQSDGRIRPLGALLETKLKRE